MNDTDESTAVLNIRRKFNEFISGASGSSIVSRLSFEGEFFLLVLIFLNISDLC